MRKVFILLMMAVAFAACHHRIKGSGNIVTEQRTISSANKVRLEGSFDVELVPGTVTSLRIEGDDNILPYVVTENEGGWLVVKSRDHLNFSTKKKLKVYITTDILESISLTGSGNIVGNGKFVGGNKLDVQISGVGNADLDVNAPSVSARISGSGNISLTGETRDADINISGVGSYKGIDLKAENAKVHVSGSGNATIFAENTLDIHVSGVGTVKYKGSAAVSQQVSGAGSVKKIE